MPYAKVFALQRTFSNSEDYTLGIFLLKKVLFHIVLCLYLGKTKYNSIHIYGELFSLINFRLISSNG